MEMKIDLKEYTVSIILTLFNSRKYAGRAIDSVANQTFKDFELIITDDGSTDDIENDILPLLKNNQGYKYIRHSNRKQPLSLNTGIRCSSGKYITLLDSDDEYMPEHLSERVKYFEENPETDLIHSPANIIGAEKDFFVPDVNDTSKLIHLSECIIGGTMFGKRKVFEDLKGFNNIYSHDSDFYTRAVKRFNVVKFDSPTYIYYRNNPDSVINNLKKSLV